MVHCQFSRGALALTALLLGCGGGGGGGGGGAAASPPITASLTASMEKALTAETVSVRWTSTQATSCAISGLPAGASGTVSPSGTLDVRFDTAGVRQLRLECAGTGATASSTITIEVVAVTTYSLATNLAALRYPESYSVPTTQLAQINKNPCDLDVDVVTYPQAWIGSRPLPTVRGAPLISSLGRGVSIKDIMLKDNPAFVLAGAPGAPNGCTGDLRAQFQRTIARLQALGADHVVMVQWHWASERSDGSWTILPAEASFGPLPDSELQYFVARAHAAGLKVLMTNQIGGMIDANGRNASIPAFSMENLRKWFGAYRPFLAERAGYFQQIGIDYWELGCNVCPFNDGGDGSPEAAAMFLSEYDTALTNMRARFTGKVWMGSVGWLFDHPEFIARLDMIATSAYVQQDVSAAESARLNVDLVRSRLAHVESSLRYLHNLGKPLLVNLDWVQARADVFTRRGYIEETGCTAGVFGDLNASNGPCVQRDVVTDFSVQAIAAEALLEVVGGSTLPPGSVVIGGQYWVTDPLMPQTAFPNFATSLRNKPAEGVLKAWFAR